MGGKSPLSFEVPRVSVVVVAVVAAAYAGVVVAGKDYTLSFALGVAALVVVLTIAVYMALTNRFQEFMDRYQELADQFTLLPALDLESLKALLPKVTVAGVAGMVVLAFIAPDNDPPVLSNWTLMSSSQECRSVSLVLDVTVTDPATWYQNDTGIESMSLGHEMQSAPQGDALSMTRTFFVERTTCDEAFVLGVGARDRAGNVGTGRVSLSSAPRPYCCDPRGAREHDCDCEGRDR